MLKHPEKKNFTRNNRGGFFVPPALIFQKPFYADTGLFCSIPVQKRRYTVDNTVLWRQEALDASRVQ